MIMNYYWNGNVRQLKNITEQISVIEQQREITPAILRSYLPAEDIERYPALFERERSEHKTFNNEREILYQVLFDMKKDMNDLKKIVNDLMLGQPVHVQPVDTGYETEIYHHDDTAGQNPTQSYTAGIPNQKKFSHVDDVETFQDVEDYQDENEVKYSLADMECELIKKSLEKNNGKRKLVAKELEISERTLYRKIKDYGIDS